MPGIEIAIVDEHGTALDADVPGEILIRGDQVSGAYVGTESKVDADGWLHTGDRGWLDIEGYLFCEGRADDTIIRGGENIGPAEVEDALLREEIGDAVDKVLDERERHVVALLEGLGEPAAPEGAETGDEDAHRYHHVLRRVRSMS